MLKSPYLVPDCGHSLFTFFIKPNAEVKIHNGEFILKQFLGAHGLQIRLNAEVTIPLKERYDVHPKVIFREGT